MLKINNLIEEKEFPIIWFKNIEKIKSGSPLEKVYCQFLIPNKILNYLMKKLIYQIIF